LNLKIITSLDGSHTLYNSVLDETYHSTNGAINESNHVFIERGLAHFFTKNECQEAKILEVGFGTGLNVWLSILWAEKHCKKLVINTLETLPLGEEITSKLNFSQHFSEKEQEFLTKIHQSAWEEEVQISEFVKLKKTNQGIENFHDSGFDIVYFDAFAPNKQAELWTAAIFKSIASMCNPNAVFTTYCAKGQVRRDLQTAGFQMERLEGPLGKREILRGTLL
jgi:tRNA U34 5-methylaminomethyl-2-thiouridine-forming methyltransferase MnmC